MPNLDDASPWALAEWRSDGCVETRFGGGAEETTRFMIGSITKTVTARLLAEAVAENAIALAEPIPGPQFFEAPITPALLATHLSGLPRVPQGFDAKADSPFSGWPVERVMDAFSKTRLWRAPGWRYEYSNFGYAVLGHYLAQKRERDFEEMTLDLLARMGVASAGFDFPAAGLDEAGNPSEPWELASFRAGGGLTMTLSDLVTYGKAVQRDDSKVGKTIREWRLPENPPALLHRRNPPVAGYGWHFDRDGKMSHSGLVAGYKSAIRLYPDGSGRAALAASLRSDTDHARIERVPELPPVAG